MSLHFFFVVRLLCNFDLVLSVLLLQPQVVLSLLLQFRHDCFGLLKLPLGFLEVGGPLAFEVHSLKGELGCHSSFYLAALPVQQTLVIGVELDKLLLGVRYLSLEDGGYRFRGCVCCQMDILILMAIHIKRCLGRWAVIKLTHLV